MSSTKKDLVITQDRIFLKPLRREKPFGVPISNVGFSAKMQIKTNYGDVAPLLTINDSNVLTTRIELGGATGTIILRIGANITAGFAVGLIGFYDLALIETADPTNIIGIIHGKILVEPAVTII